MRRANFCPQIRLRAALQGSDEALHNVHAALSKMVALLLPLLRMLEDGDAAFSPQPPKLLGKSENGWLVVTLQAKLRNQSATRFALPFPGTAIARVSPYFASARMGIGLLP